MIRKYCTDVEIALNKNFDDNESYGDGDEDVDHMVVKYYYIKHNYILYVVVYMH